MIQVLDMSSGTLLFSGVLFLTTSSVTPQILTSMLPRMALTASPTLIQTLVLVFARLIHVNAAPVIGKLLLFCSSTCSSPAELLSKTPTPDGSPALAFLLKVWVDNQSSFYGSYQAKVTLFALVHILKLNNPTVSMCSL